MLDALRNEILKIGNSKHYYASFWYEKELVKFLVLKYYCDKKIYKYSDVINKDKFDNLKFPTDEKEILNIENPRLLSLIEHYNLKDLVLEYLSNDRLGINLIKEKKDIICIPLEFSKEIYDISGNTTYVINLKYFNNYGLNLLKFFDIVLEINNKYIKYEEIHFSDYKTLYIYDFLPKYNRYIDQQANLNLIINNGILGGINNVILHSNFKKLSNISNLKIASKYLKKIILFDDVNTILVFNKLDDKISIINYNKDKIKSIEKLYEIIENNRKIKDILIKITHDDIKNNYYRIGFKLYQESSNTNARNINEIVEENTRFIRRLSDLDLQIEQEINTLMNR